jgi:hypothetical protein
MRQDKPPRNRKMALFALRTLVPLACVLVAEGGGRSRGILDEKKMLEAEQPNQTMEVIEDSICGMDLEENHIGKMYLDFNGEPSALTDDDVLILQELLSDAYTEASSKNCREGYRSLYGIEIDKKSIFPSEYGNQYRIQMNVTTRCRGCSHDLRVFSSTNLGRSQGRFLQKEQQHGLLGQGQDGVGPFGNRNDKRGQELFLQDQTCRCPPPSRDQVLNGLRIRLKDLRQEGRFKSLQELTSIGAYFSGLKTRQSATMTHKFTTMQKANTTATATEMICSQQPPFSEPFDLPDVVAFQGISSCPFFLHDLALGESVGTCFPVYDIPSWYNAYSVSFMLSQLKLGKTLFFEKESVFATWEDLVDITSMDDFLGTKNCLRSLSVSAVGVNGEISGEAGTEKIKAVVISFTENGKERHVLLPIGGCEDAVYSMQKSDKQRHLELHASNAANTCSIQPNQADEDEWTECLEQCHAIAQAIYDSTLDKLEKHRDEKLSINYVNEKAVLDKLFLTRASDMVLGFAECQCRENSILEQCLLEVFVEAVATETDQRFEALEIFGQHRQNAEKQFADQKELACEVAKEAGISCQEQC